MNRSRRTFLTGAGAAVSAACSLHRERWAPPSPASAATSDMPRGMTFATTSRGDRAGSAIVAWAVSISRARATGSLETVGPWGPIASDDGSGAAAGTGAAGGGVGGGSAHPARAATRAALTRNRRPHRPPITVSERNDVGHPRAWPRRGS